MRIVLPTLHVRSSAQSVALAAGCLKAALPESLQSRTMLLDFFPSQSDDQIVQTLLSDDPDLIGFPLYVWNRGRVCRLARRLRKIRPSLILVAGGPECFAAPETVIKEGGFDAVIVGEGEERFRELVERLAKGEAPTGGIAPIIRGGDDSCAAAPVRTELPSPWLSRTLTPPKAGGVLWETSRGCPFACTFCFDGRGTQGLKAFPFPRLEAELELFVRRQVSQVWVLDSTFNHPPERGKKLLKLLVRKAPHVHFHLEAKAEFLDAETAGLLAKLTCSVQIGLQSIHPEVLKNIRRTIDPQQFTQKIRLLADKGVTYGLDLIYGLPGDDYRGFCQSLNFALSLAPNHVDIFPLAVLPGCELHRRAAEYGIRAMAAPPYEILASTSCSAAELDACRLLAAATDLFYNTGRAVGFFSIVLRIVEQNATTFLQEFAAWVIGTKKVPREKFLAGEDWRAAEAYGLQEEYLVYLLRKQRRGKLSALVKDLLRYHFHYAETLLGAETLPPTDDYWSGMDLWRTPLRRAAGLRLVSFSHEINSLLEMGETNPERLVGLVRPVGSTAVFLRRGDQVFCESLEEDFLQLLRGCDGKRTAERIFSRRITVRKGQDLVRFALAEGFLLPATKKQKEPMRRA